AADRHPDRDLRALRPQELAPRRAAGRAAGPAPVRDLDGPQLAGPGGDAVALGGVELQPHPTPPAPPLRRHDPADPGRRLDLRRPHHAPAPPPGRRGPTVRTVSPPTTARRRRHGRGLPRRAPAPEAALRPEADPPRRRRRPPRPRTLRA